MSNSHKLGMVFALTLTTFYSFAITKNFTCLKKNETDSIFFLIYNQDFQKAEDLLSNSTVILKPIEYNLLTTDLFWWKALSVNNENDFNALESYLLKKLGTSEKLNNRNYLEELIYLNYLIRLMTIKNQYVKILKYFFQINSIVEKVDNSVLSGEEQNIFEIYSAVFNITKSKFFFTKQQFRFENIQILKKYMASSNQIHKTISCYFLAKIYAEIEKSPDQSLLYFSFLNNLYPENKIFRHELTTAKLKSKNNIKPDL